VCSCKGSCLLWLCISQPGAVAVCVIWGMAVGRDSNGRGSERARGCPSLLYRGIVALYSLYSRIVPPARYSRIVAVEAVPPERESEREGEGERQR
jgi:hypothetical protein